MPNCVVKGCKHQSSKDKKQDGITFHTFPNRDQNIKEKWVAVIRDSRKEQSWQPTSRSVVCSVHFNSDDLYYTYKGLRRVVKNGYPKILPNIIEGSNNVDLSYPPSIQEEPAAPDLSNDLNLSQPSKCTATDDHQLIVVKEEMSEDDSMAEDESEPNSEARTLTTVPDVPVECSYGESSMAVDTHFSEVNIKTEPVEDSKEGITMEYTHKTKTVSENEILKHQLETNNALLDEYRNEMKDMQDKNLVLLEQFDQLTKLVRNTLDKTPSKKIELRLKQILALKKHRKSKEYTEPEPHTEEQYKEQIKMLENNLKQLHENLADKERHWDIKTKELEDEMTQMKEHYKDLILNKADNTAVQFLEKENSWADREREWLEKERKWIEHLKLKEQQWQAAVSEAASANSALREEYKNEIKDLQDKNFILQEHCEQLTELVEKCLNKTDLKEVKLQYNQILEQKKSRL